MKVKITIISIIVAASTLYSRDNNSSYIPAISNAPRPPGNVMNAPGLPSKQQDLDKIASLEQRVKQLERQINTAQQDNDQLKRNISQLDLDLQDAHEWMNEYYKQLFVPLFTGWVYHAQHGWLYTDHDAFPYMYRDADQTWLYFARDHKDSSDRRAFFNYTTNEWEIWK